MSSAAPARESWSDESSESVSRAGDEASSHGTLAEQTRFGIVIPARFNSTRLPGKPLRDLCGKPMIVWVLENARRTGADYVIVATDDQRIAEAVSMAGGDAMLTSRQHASGTDRLAEVAERKQLGQGSVIVNWQGDEPLLEPHTAHLVADALVKNPPAGIATLATPIAQVHEHFDPNVVKVVTARSGMALYFSRAPIPWRRDGSAPEPGAGGTQCLRHVGVYAYRVSTLLELAQSKPVAIEMAESLEQLRALWLGIPIHVTRVAAKPEPGVDTEEDLVRAAAILKKRHVESITG
jgi:3-deoxy-manno-octulosonate cytidylyltransferase (CMP-KDO synthetase)